MSLEKGIFISYAHIDNEALIDGERGWVSEFHRSLEIRLAQLLGFKPKIWRDNHLKGNDEFSKEIKEQFSNIAVLISILSPRYVKSDWCLKEVNGFLKASEQSGGLNIKNQSRLFKVIKTPVERVEHPSPMQGLLGYEFYRMDQETGRVKEFSKIFGPESQRDYWARLDDISHDLSVIIKEIQKNTKLTIDTEIQEVNTILPHNGKSIYLAETSHDKKDDRDALRRYLTEQGFEVTPNTHLPIVEEEYRSEVKKLIDSSELSIHILGNNYGFVPEGTIKSNIEIQNEIAAEASESKGLKRLIWHPLDINTEDSRQLDFIERINAQSNLIVGSELIKSSLEDFQFAIDDKLKEKEEKNTSDQKETQTISSSDLPFQIYLVCQQEDLANICELEDYFFNLGHEVILPVFEGDQTELRLDHQENLQNCDGVIIFHGEGNDLWLRSKVRDLMKIAGYGRTKPLSAKSVYLHPPTSVQKERCRFQNIEVINGLNGFQSQNFNSFLSKIKTDNEQ